MREHEFKGEVCTNCNARQQQVLNGAMPRSCLPAERKDENSAGEHGTRIGTVYMRTKAPLSPEAREQFMRELAERIQLNTLAGKPWPWKIVNGTTLMIEIDTEVVL